MTPSPAPAAKVTSVDWQRFDPYDKTTWPEKSGDHLVTRANSSRSMSLHWSGFVWANFSDIVSWAQLPPGYVPPPQPKVCPDCNHELKGNCCIDKGHCCTEAVCNKNKAADYDRLAAQLLAATSLAEARERVVEAAIEFRRGGKTPADAADLMVALVEAVDALPKETRP